MFVPFVSVPRHSRSKHFYRRKGGGGGGGKSGGGGRSGGGGSGKSGFGGVGGGKTTSINAGGSRKGAAAYGNGGGRPLTIPSGQLFAGRSAGGGTRNQVYGNREYGSGYPGVQGRGVNNRGFPFFFWPLAWGGAGGYLYTREYGRPDNSSRPGGPLLYTAITSSSQNTTFRILADNATVVELVSDIQSNCSSSLSAGTPSTPTPYDDSLSSWPQPEQTIQYYRASTVALTLDGYNNTAALGADGTPDVPLPTNIDTTLLNCLNLTIGAAVPLVNGGAPTWLPPNLAVFGFLWIVWYLLDLL